MSMDGDGWQDDEQRAAGVWPNGRVLDDGSFVPSDERGVLVQECRDCGQVHWRGNIDAPVTSCVPA